MKTMTPPQTMHKINNKLTVKDNLAINFTHSPSDLAYILFLPLKHCMNINTSSTYHDNV